MHRCNCQKVNLGAALGLDSVASACTCAIPPPPSVPCVLPRDVTTEDDSSPVPLPAAGGSERKRRHRAHSCCCAAEARDEPHRCAQPRSQRVLRSHRAAVAPASVVIPVFSGASSLQRGKPSVRRVTQRATRGRAGVAQNATARNASAGSSVAANASVESAVSSQVLNVSAVSSHAMNVSAAPAEELAPAASTGRDLDAAEAAVAEDARARPGTPPSINRIPRGAADPPVLRTFKRPHVPEIECAIDTHAAAARREVAAAAPAALPAPPPPPPPPPHATQSCLDTSDGVPVQPSASVDANASVVMADVPEAQSQPQPQPREQPLEPQPPQPQQEPPCEDDVCMERSTHAEGAAVAQPLESTEPPAGVVDTTSTAMAPGPSLAVPMCLSSPLPTRGCGLDGVPAWCLRAQRSGAVMHADPRVHASARAYEASHDRPNALRNHGDLNERMHFILVDWLLQVRFKFKLLPETHFLGLELIDEALRRTQHEPRAKLQLVGIVAFQLACKVHEIYAPEVRDWVYICDKAYTREEFLSREASMLKKIAFAVVRPTALTFFHWYALGVFEAHTHDADGTHETYAVADDAGRDVSVPLGSTSIEDVAAGGPCTIRCRAAPDTNRAMLAAELLLWQAASTYALTSCVAPSMVAAACVFAAWQTLSWTGRIASWADVVRDGRCDYQEAELAWYAHKKLRPHLRKLTTSSSSSSVDVASLPTMTRFRPAAAAVQTALAFEDPRFR
jgi:hypothetical protein